jgi:hypothetical protein
VKIKRRGWAKHVAWMGEISVSYSFGRKRERMRNLGKGEI